jgi:hypothetical protein
VQSIDAQPGCLLGSVRVNFNAVASGLRSFEQMRKSRAISDARIERRELRWEDETISKALGFRDGQWVESQLGLSMWPHCAPAECRDRGRREKNKEGKD